MRYWLPKVFSSLFFITSGILHAQEAGMVGKSLKYVCYRAEAPLKMDGKPDEGSWKKAPWTTSFVDIEGDKKPKPHFKTRAKMLWDEKYFYIYTELEEPHLWATYDKRDSVIFHENDIEVFIDPDGDTHNYYELEINAKGTEWDLMLLKPYRDGGGAIDSWDILGLKKGIDLRGTLNDPSDVDKGWSVEMAIPWKVLEEAASPQRVPKSGEQWRVNFSRVQWQLTHKDGIYTKKIDPKSGKPLREYNWVWSPQGVIAMHQPESWGRVQFSDVVAGKGKQEFIEKREDTLKDALRLLYYAQSQYKKPKNSYATNLNKLVQSGLLTDTFLTQWGSHISLTTDTSGYRATLQEGKLKVVIDEFGKVRTL